VLILIAHRILIGAGVLAGIFFTIWQAVKYRQTSQLEHLIVGIVAAIVTLAMAYYLKNLRRFVKL
jgi:type III secretory pathway component EscS